VTPDRAELQATVRYLAGLDRPSCSPGEREAAEWVAGRLREHGADARVEDERAHGTYWWPAIVQGAIAAGGGLAALRGHRVLGASAAAFAATAMYDDVSGGSQWFRRLLPWRDTSNVVAEAGDRSARRTVVFVAHHDAAHGGAIFDDSALRWFGDRFPDLYDRADNWPPVAGMPFGVAALIAAAALTGRRGLLRAGLALSALSLASFADIAAREVVPGANDNATAVAVIVDLARALRQEPVEGVRVLLVSTGSEESHMEGMRAFARRHFPSLDPATTTVVCLDTVGSDAELVLVEGEGMIRIRDYPDEVKGLVDRAARRTGVRLRRGLQLRFSTDGLIALRAGYPSASIGSINRYRLPSNYHKPTDTADNVDYDRVAGAAKICDEIVRELAAA
jgi:Peptidase family M28